MRLIRGELWKNSTAHASEINAIYLQFKHTRISDVNININASDYDDNNTIWSNRRVWITVGFPMKGHAVSFG